MNHYIIDGNNLIGRIKSFQQLQKKDKQASREKLVNLLNKYFAGKKIKLTLHFDGHPNLPLSITKGKIEYSKNDISDNLIRREIESSKNPRLLILITSDHGLMNFGKVCGCTIISSDEFHKSIEQSFEKNDEEERIQQLSNDKNEFLKLFQERNIK
jgi:predicted RNA-binding protein with PIN domain